MSSVLCCNLVRKMIHFRLREGIKKMPSGVYSQVKENNYFNCCRRALEDRELETRIKMHMDKLQDHRTKTYGSIQEELESARKNLDMASVRSRLSEYPYQFNSALSCRRHSNLAGGGGGRENLFFLQSLTNSLTTSFVQNIGFLKSV